MTAKLSFNPDASPAALTRRPLGAGSLVRWASHLSLRYPNA